jgi:hypothetical protein
MGGQYWSGLQSGLRSARARVRRRTPWHPVDVVGWRRAVATPSDTATHAIVLAFPVGMPSAMRRVVGQHPGRYPACLWGLLCGPDRTGLERSAERTYGDGGWPQPANGSTRLRVVLVSGRPLHARRASQWSFRPPEFAPLLPKAETPPEGRRRQSRGFRLDSDASAPMSALGREKKRGTTLLTSADVLISRRKRAPPMSPNARYPCLRARATHVSERALPMVPNAPTMSLGNVGPRPRGAGGGFCTEMADVADWPNEARGSGRLILLIFFDSFDSVETRTRRPRAATRQKLCTDSQNLSQHLFCTSNFYH